MNVILNIILRQPSIPALFLCLHVMAENKRLCILTFLKEHHAALDTQEISGIPAKKHLALTCSGNVFFLCLLAGGSLIIPKFMLPHVLLTLPVDENSKHTLKCCFLQIYPIAATKPTDQKALPRCFIPSESSSLAPGASTHFPSPRPFSVAYRSSAVTGASPSCQT